MKQVEIYVRIDMYIKYIWLVENRPKNNHFKETSTYAINIRIHSSGINTLKIARDKTGNNNNGNVW